VVPPDDLVEAADPEQRLGFTAHVAEPPGQLRRPLEQRQLARILAGPIRVLVPLLKETRVHDPAAGQGEIGFDRVQRPVSFGQRAGLAPKTARWYSNPARSIRSSTPMIASLIPPIA
jgi:hypothetical protein